MFNDDITKKLSEAAKGIMMPIEERKAPKYKIGDVITVDGTKGKITKVILDQGSQPYYKVKVGNKEELHAEEDINSGTRLPSIKSEGVEENLSEDITPAQLKSVEDTADLMLKRYKVDVEFTKHFIDRVNDDRNSPEINADELVALFAKIAKNKGKQVKKAEDVEAVIKDLTSNLNLPIVVNRLGKMDFEMVAKTIMRKKNFQVDTKRNKVIKYESTDASEIETLEEGKIGKTVEEIKQMFQKFKGKELPAKMVKVLQDIVAKFDDNVDMLKKLVKANIPYVSLTAIGRLTWKHKISPSVARAILPESFEINEMAYPHMMYDPDTGDAVEVNDEDEHEEYAEMGWVHKKPEVKKEESKLNKFAHLFCEETEELEEAEADLPKDVLKEAKYEIKNGVVHITKAEYKKVHRDFKGKFPDGSHTMLVNDPKAGGSMLATVKFVTEEVGELEESLSQAKVGDYLYQRSGRDAEIYSLIIDKLKNGGFKVVSFTVWDGRIAGKAKMASTKNAYPQPQLISKDEIPPKVLSKIEDKAPKNESVEESVELEESNVTPQKISDEDLNKIFDNLKSKQKVDIWFDSGIRKGTEYVQFEVGRKSHSKKYNVDTITFKRVGSESRLKYSLYRYNNRGGSIAFATGDMAAPLIDIRMSKNESVEESVELEEGVYDPAIFKAAFLAGGPGSGKSFTVGKTALTALGMKIVNSDDKFEAALKKANLEMTPENIFSPIGQELRKGAKGLTAKQMKLFIDGRLGLVIDGTGKDYAKIKKQADKLKELGYEVAMIFVNTDLDTALNRNRKRSRSLPDEQVKKMWSDVQNNIGKFQSYFKQEFTIIDNSEGIDIERGTLNGYKKMKKFVDAEPKSPIAKKWIKKQLGEGLEESVELEEANVKGMSDEDLKDIQKLIKSGDADLPKDVLKAVKNEIEKRNIKEESEEDEGDEEELEEKKSKKSKKKEIKIRVNPQGMMGSASRTHKAKKGKGSFSRREKHQGKKDQ